MPSAERTFTVTPSPTAVLDYLKDFSHAEQWDPGTETCTQNGAGPVQVGTSWHNTSKLAGRTTELTYTLVELTNDKIVFVGENDSAKTIDTVTVRPAGTGSEVTYHADLVLHGAAKLATPLAKLGFEKLGNDTEKQLSQVLNELTG